LRPEKSAILFLARGHHELLSLLFSQMSMMLFFDFAERSRPLGKINPFEDLLNLGTVEWIAAERRSKLRRTGVILALEIWRRRTRWSETNFLRRSQHQLGHFGNGVLARARIRQPPPFACPQKKTRVAACAVGAYPPPANVYFQPHNFLSWMRVWVERSEYHRKHVFGTPRSP